MTPFSSELMFTPQNRRVTVSDDCPQVVPSFEGSEGLMVTGHIEPALKGAKITISLNEKEVFSTTTDSKGRYR